MSYLNQKESILLGLGALHTAREIALQPLLWKQTIEKFNRESNDINSFLKKAYKESSNVILTGAGTSAFIGLSLQGSYFNKSSLITRALATTDIVSYPKHYFNTTEIPLIISFARSGNSPESCAALALADNFSAKCFHLIITCDAEGELAKYQSKNPVHVFVLPTEANDKSLAMTGSYTSMLLTGLLIAYIDQMDFCAQQVGLLERVAQKILNEDLETIMRIAAKDFQRAVFLGSGALFGTATEAALKLQELTDGQVICKADTYLGIRHGPKAVIDENTLVIYFFSNSHYVQQYEEDLVHAMKTGNSAMFQLGISEHTIQIKELQAQITLTINNQTIAEDFLPVCSIVVGQLIAFYKSLQLGIMPDAPSVSGSISRVVQGVQIYSVKK
ncbi:SIS domain-containing protein [soil metagenome]